jgi:uncharacterized Zn finger protein
MAPRRGRGRRRGKDGDWGWSRFPPRSQPREAKGGIRAQSQRGRFGETWWARRWIDVLESFELGARLSRGRSYARSGQVLNIDVHKGQVTARVQGSRPKPYSVTINVKQLTNEQWEKVLEVLSRQALFVAKLLAGEMPQEIEKVFKEAGQSLFPARARDLDTDCSCPDWSNPCKHIAAVYYLLGEEFDRDPFLLFQMRGLGREELLERLGRLAPAGGQAAEEPAAPAEALPSDPSAFWAAPTLPDDLFGEVARPPAPAAWLRRLGKFPFWRGEQNLLDTLAPLYEAASERGLDTFLGERAPRKE